MSFYTSVNVIGNKICIREIDDNGCKIQKKIHYKPFLFVPTNKTSKYQSLFGQPLQKIDFEDIKSAREFIRQYKEVDNFKIHGYSNFEYPWIAENYPQEDIVYNKNFIRIFFLDIETEVENAFPKAFDPTEKINLITVKVLGGKFHVFALDNYQTQYKVHRKDVIYKAFKTEEELLLAFVEFWVSNYPDIVTHWNGAQFDIPYIYNRICVLIGEDVAKTLSPWKTVRKKTLKIMGQDVETYTFLGISLLDYLQLYKKNILEPRESYSLGYIAQHDLNITKIDHTEYKTFSEFYQKDFQKYTEYNIRDTELLELLDDKWQLLEKSITVGFMMHVNWEDTLSQVRCWENYIYFHLGKRNQYVALKEPSDKDEEFAGAYVKEPIPGLYNWVFSVDVSGLYPNLMASINISPETIINEIPENISEEDILSGKQYPFLKENNYSASANGYLYKRDKQGIIPELLTHVLKQKDYYNDLAAKSTDPMETARYDMNRSAYKVSGNSAYGAIGNEFFSLYDLRTATSVTISGRTAIQFVASRINAYLNKVLKTQNKDYVVMIDTDSNYVVLDDLVNKVLPNETDKLKIAQFVDKVCSQKIQPIIDQAFKDFAETLNMYKNTFVMKREKIMDGLICTAKKRYAMSVVIDEKDKKHIPPKVSFKGLEAVKANNPKFCRDKMKEGVNLIFTTRDNQKLIDFISETKKTFMSLPLIEISKPSGINEFEKYINKDKNNNLGDYFDDINNLVFLKGTPFHIKSALLFNYLITEKKLDKKYPKIKKSDKIKILMLKELNPTMQNAIGYLDTFPSEFGLDTYIDKEQQWDKTFLEPFTIILEAISYTNEKIDTLDDWF